MKTPSMQARTKVLASFEAGMNSPNFPWHVNITSLKKDTTVTQDTSPKLCSRRHDEYLFGRAKTGGLGQVTTKKIMKKMGITRPRPDGGVTSKGAKQFVDPSRLRTYYMMASAQRFNTGQILSTRQIPTCL